MLGMTLFQFKKTLILLELAVLVDQANGDVADGFFRLACSKKMQHPDEYSCICSSCPLKINQCCTSLSIKQSY